MIDRWAGSTMGEKKCISNILLSVQDSGRVRCPLLSEVYFLSSFGLRIIVIKTGSCSRVCHCSDDGG